MRSSGSISRRTTSRTTLARQTLFRRFRVRRSTDRINSYHSSFSGLLRDRDRHCCPSTTIFSDVEPEDIVVDQPSGDTARTYLTATRNHLDGTAGAHQLALRHQVHWTARYTQNIVQNKQTIFVIDVDLSSIFPLSTGAREPSTPSMDRRSSLALSG